MERRADTVDTCVDTPWQASERTGCGDAARFRPDRRV